MVGFDAQLFSQLPDRAKLRVLEQLGHLRPPSQQAAPGGAAGLEALLHGLADRGYAHLDAFLPTEQLAAARREARGWLAAHGRPARLGGGGERRADAEARGDITAWLRPDALAAAGCRALPALLRALRDRLRPALARRGWDVGGELSFQLASYPGRGSGYLRHADASDSSPGRTLTALCYLNEPGWDVGSQGGALRVFAGRPDPATGLAPCAAELAPEGGRLVLFDSRLQHEVSPSFTDRLAVTCWFTRAPTVAAAEAAETSAAGAAANEAAAARPASDSATVRGALDASLVTRPGHTFVAIPSYRDSETQWTLDDLFSKAARPDLLRVGVVWQVDWEADDVAPYSPPGRAAQVRHAFISRGEATGPCKARALAQQLHDGEEFYLQVDSHMRFVPGWDASLAAWLADAERASSHGRAVLSSYPPGYEGEGAGARLPAGALPTLLCAGGFGAGGMLRLVGRKLREPPLAPLPAPFWAAGLSFSRARLISEVPYPRGLPWLFAGEETLQLARMWTAGWDVYAPPEPVAFHLWSRKHRPTFDADAAPDAAAAERSRRAVAALLAGESGELQRRGVGLGCRRSLQAFYDWTGVDFAARVVSDRARNAGLPPDAFV